MSRLPTPGGDEGSWGSILNDFLSVEHNPDGTLKLSGTLSIKYTKPSTGIPKSDLEASVQATLGKADGALLASNNLSDVADAPTSRTNLGLGTAAVKNIPATGNASATEVVYGSDTRLTDSRTPTTHEATHQSGGSDALTGNIDAVARVAVAKSGASTGSRRMVNFIPGSGIDVTTADDSANEKVDVTLAALSTNNGQMELISEQYLGSDTANINFSSIPQTYRHLMVLWQARQASTGARMGMRVNGDSGTNYDYSHSWFNGGSLGGNVQLAQTYSEVNHIVGTDGTTGASAASSGILWFTDYARTGGFYRPFHGNGNFPWVGTYYGTVISGSYRNASPITSLLFYMTNSANFKAGTIFSLYGVKATAPTIGAAGAPETINIIASVPSGQSIGAGVIGDVKIPFDATIDSIDIVGDTTGSCVLDIYSSSTDTGIATSTSANSICGTNLPTISSAQTYANLSLSTWNTALTAGNWLRFVVNSSSWFTRLSISLKIRRA